MAQDTIGSTPANPPGPARPGGSKAGLIFLALLVLIGAGAGVYFWKFAGKGAPTGKDEPTIDCGNGVTMELARVPAGEFMMGSPDEEDDHDDSESPRHKVTIGRGFYVGKFEVTEAQWKAVMGYKNATNLPAAEVDWYDCQKFCTDLSKRTGRKVRLPSEAEWEYACRAGTSTPYWSGEALKADVATFDPTPPGPPPVVPKGATQPAATKPGKPLGPLPVGQGKRANAFGLYDTHGNVWEWCEDVYHENYKGAPADGSAWVQGGADPNLHVYRGGGYVNPPEKCRSAIRYSAAEVRVAHLGFRVVVELVSK